MHNNVRIIAGDVRNLLILHGKGIRIILIRKGIVINASMQHTFA